MKKLYIILALSTLLAACSNEENVQYIGESKLDAVVETDGKISRVGFEKMEKSWSFFWHNGDEIWVNEGIMSTDDADKSKTATFTGYGINTNSGYAVYPFAMAEDNVSGSQLTWNFPSSYNYTDVDESFFESAQNIPMFAKIVNGRASFRHLGAIVAFKFNEWEFTGEHVFSLTTSKKITGEFTTDLSTETPVFVTEEEVEDVVTINYNRLANAGNTPFVFYVPVPTGTYDIKAKVTVDGKTKFTKSSKNKTVKRGDIVWAEIGESVLVGDNKDFKSVSSVDDIENVLFTEKEELMVQVTEEVKGQNTIVIPSDLKSIYTTFLFSSVDGNAEITINAEDDVYAGQVIIEIPETETIPIVTANIPNGEVYIKQGNVTTLVASSKKNTTVIGKDAVVETLIVEKGNVRIEDGGKVTTIKRQEGNQDNVTYVIYEAATAPTITLGEGVLLVSAAEFDLLTAVANGGEVTLTSDVVLTTTMEISNGKTVTIDLNGHIISQSKECTGSYSMITNMGTLTIKDTSSEGDGKITFKDLSNGGGSDWGSYVITNRGTLVVENGTLEHLGTADNNFDTNLPIQNYAGKVTINGGKISSQQFRSVRDFTAGGEIVINGGVFEGQVWMQGLGNGSSSLTINGGEFAPTANDGSSVYITNGTNDIIVSINGGKFNTKIGCVDATKTGIKGSVKGGIFTESAKTNTNNALIAEGCAFVETADGYWEIEKSWEKTSETSYTIYSANGMRWLAEQVNSGHETFVGKTIMLGADIDLKNEEWTPIGTETKNFEGNFDGGNKVVKGLKITTHQNTIDEYGIWAYAGLFGVTSGNENLHNSIKNLVIENVNILSTGDIVSAAVAYPYYTDIENVTVKGNITIKGGNYTAGVLAYTRRCVNAKNLTIEGNAGSSIEGKQTVGGVISDIQMNGGLIANYSNFAASGLTIKGTKSVGGISGIISSQTLDGATVKNVTINCDDNRKGIVSGSLGGKSTINNVSYENVTGASVVIGGNYDIAQPIEAKIGNQYYSLFSEALKNVKNGETITLLSNITLEEGLTISKEQNLTIDLNGKTVTANCKKAFEVYADVTIENGTIISQQRCVDTRTNVNLTLTDVTLKADTYYSAYGNQQPLTIGGSTNGTKVSMTNVTIDAGYQGYAIISFVKTELTAINSTLNGYAALYVKEGSDASQFNFNSSTLSGTTGSNDVDNNSFATIAIEANNVKVTLDANSNLNSTGDCHTEIFIIEGVTGSSVSGPGVK